MSGKRTPFTSEEELEMWNFFIEKVRKRDISAQKFEYKIWVEFCFNILKVKKANSHSALSTSKHFIRHMIPKIDEAPISNEDIFEILDFCPLKCFQQNPIGLKNLEKRLKHRLIINKSNYIHFFAPDQEFDLNGCFLSEDLQIDLAYYQDLVLINKENQDKMIQDDLGLKELMRFRVRLILQKVLPVNDLFEDVPESVKKKLTEFYELIEWCLSDDDTPLWNRHKNNV